MDSATFIALSNTIKARRTIKANMMNGQKAPNAHIAALLELADWAPTHAYTEPWRFIVYENPAEFCAQHAEIYKAGVSDENFNPTVYNNLAHQGDLASHVVLAIMQRSPLGKIPVFEEEAAVSSAIQNILLGATALNMASFWSTGGAALKPAMKEFLQLGEEDRLMGVLYLGYADVHPEGKRTVAIEDKIKWVK